MISGARLPAAWQADSPDWLPTSSLPPTGGTVTYLGSFFEEAPEIEFDISLQPGEATLSLPPVALETVSP